MDLRYATSMADANLCGVGAVSGEVGDRLVPGAPEDSRIFERMATRGVWQMPPLATDVVDPVGVGVVRAWIESLDACPDASN
jgi:hypothetical protein